MLWRLAGCPVPFGHVLSFTGADQAGDYAYDALCWAVERGVMNGRGNGILDPKGFATQAQAAQLLKNFSAVSPPHRSSFCLFSRSLFSPCRRGFSRTWLSLKPSAALVPNLSTRLRMSRL